MPITDRRTFVMTSLTVLALPRQGTTAKAPVLRFGLVTDAHYADYDTLGNRYYRQSLTKMRECVENMQQQGAQFLVDLGDFNDGARKPAEQEALQIGRAHV